MVSLIPRLLGLLWFCSACIGLCWCQDQPFIISSFTLPEIWLRPYDYTYLRVEIPPWFSSAVLMFVSEVEIDKFDMKQISKSNLPLVCFKDGSPPIPDISDSFLDSSLSNFLVNGSSGGTQDIRGEQCIPFQKNLSMVLSNEQISPGVWYFGFFNGLGPARTQSKMIIRGRSYMFRANIVVQGCPSSTIWGPYCNQSIDMVSCSQSFISKNSSLPDVNIYKNNNLKYSVTNRGHLGVNYHLPKQSTIQGKQVVSNSSSFMGAENMVTCKDPFESSCLRYGNFKLYFLDVVNVASQFTITATDFKFNQTSSMDITAVPDGILLMCYARYNAMPRSSLHDHSADISSTPLIVKSPKIGRWYVAVQAVNQTNENTMMQESYFEGTLCFSFEWKVHECVNGKAGLNCSWEAHMLQRVPRRGGITSGSYYLPIDKNVPMEIDDDEFPLDGLLSNSSSQNSTWTYFFLDIPHGAAGANMHIQLESEMKLTYEVYSKYGGLASTDSWDYYANSSSSSNGSAILTLDDSSEGKINFYILYAREGPWCFGLKHPPVTHYKELATMSISIVGCPKHCSLHGQCHYTVDESGLSFYSYCACDRDHGGFDCSIELVSPKGRIWQSIFLVASNAAAILPAFLALRRKAFAEWVLFSSSGISSGLYHACDVGTWCALSFHVLQFMDFWLSFMAVVSTFVYMSTISEASKRAIHTAVAIITALLAETGATRSENIVIVIAIGTLGLFIAWLLEFSTSYRPTYCAQGWNLNMNDRWPNIIRWFWNLINILHKRFCWRLVVLGFITLAFAATSWTLENNKSYWIWHSDEPRPEVAYELTRQDSLPRVD